MVICVGFRAAQTTLLYAARLPHTPRTCIQALQTDTITIKVPGGQQI